MENELANIESDLGGDVCTNRKMYGAGSALLQYTRAPGNYQYYPRLKSLTHKSVVEIDVLIWRVGLQWPVMSSKLDYNSSSLIPSSHQRWTSEMNKVPHRLQNEVVYKKQRPELGDKTAVQLELRSMDVLKI